MLVYPGDARHQEDGFYLQIGQTVRYFRGAEKKRGYVKRLDGLEGNFCLLAIDAYSSVYNPRNGPAMIGKYTTGQVVSRSIISTFFRSSLPPVERLLLANQKIHRLAEIATTQSDPDDAGILPGASYVLAYAENGILHIAQGGDCFAVWEHCDSTLGVTDNQVLRHDYHLLELQKKLEAEAETVGLTGRDKTYYVWDTLAPATIKAQRKDVNIRGGYSIINGQNFLPYAAHTRLPLNRIKRLVLATDGLVKYRDFYYETYMAQRIMSKTKKTGLSAVLKETQGQDDIGFSSNPEAAALNIEFA
jgi:serine/threonine protein phosphatase PrpC